MGFWDVLIAEILNFFVDDIPAAPELKGKKKWVNQMISILWYIGVCLFFFILLVGIGYMLMNVFGVMLGTILRVLGLPLNNLPSGEMDFSVAEERIKFFSKILSAVTLVLVVFGLLFYCFGRSKRKKCIENLGRKCVILRKKKQLFWTGTGGGILLFIVSTMVSYSEMLADNKYVLIFLLVLVFLCPLFPLIVVPYLTWKIELCENTDYLIYRNIIGISYKIRYEDILCYEEHTQSIVVRTKRKKFSVGYEVTNYERLIEAFSDHGIDRLRFYAWQKEKNSAALDQDNEPDALPRPRKRRFYKGKGPY